jgi:hypothetical protein
VDAAEAAVGAAAVVGAALVVGEVAGGALVATAAGAVVADPPVVGAAGWLQPTRLIATTANSTSLGRVFIVT